MTFRLTCESIAPSSLRFLRSILQASGRSDIDREQALNRLRERLQFIRTAWMTRFTHRLGFNLTNPLARDIKLLADFFERIVCTHLNTEAHPQYFRFARGKRLEQFLHSIL